LAYCVEAVEPDPVVDNFVRSFVAPVEWLVGDVAEIEPAMITVVVVAAAVPAVVVATAVQIVLVTVVEPANVPDSYHLATEFAVVATFVALTAASVVVGIEFEQTVDALLVVEAGLIDFA